jgi:hypothetical protein
MSQLPFYSKLKQEASQAILDGIRNGKLTGHYSRHAKQFLLQKGFAYREGTTYYINIDRVREECIVVDWDTYDYMTDPHARGRAQAEKLGMTYEEFLAKREVRIEKRKIRKRNQRLEGRERKKQIKAQENNELFSDVDILTAGIERRTYDKADISQTR